jgi:hypothetical protein
VLEYWSVVKAKSSFIHYSTTPLLQHSKNDLKKRHSIDIQSKIMHPLSLTGGLNVLHSAGKRAGLPMVVLTFYILTV